MKSCATPAHSPSSAVVKKSSASSRSVLRLPYEPEDIIAALFNDLLGDLGLTAHGIDGDDATLPFKEF